MTSLLRITAENHRQHLERILEIEALSFSTPWPAGGFSREFENPMAALWAAMVNGRAAGFICYWVLDFEIHLLDLAVHPEERRKGAGRLLLNHMIREAASRELESAWLEVRVSNAGAFRLYQDAGFEQVGVRPRYYDDTGEDALVMRLAFPGALAAPERHAFGGS